MRPLGCFSLFCIAALANAGVVAADEPVPLQVRLRPQMLSISATARIELTCELTNTSDKPIAVDWDTLQVSMFPRQINVSHSDGSMSKKVKLAAGESQTRPVVIRLGEDLPALDEGDYELAFNVAMDAAGERRHLRESLPLTIVAHEGEKPATTAASLVAAAREYAMKKGGGEKLGVESYLIRRRGKEWDVELTLRGPKQPRSLTVSLEATGKRAYELAIP